MNGWTRHQYAYVPGGRSVGVSQVNVPAVGGPALPSCPESNSMSASAIGYAMPVLRLHGNAQSVMECQVPYPDPGASVFRKRIDCPWWTVGIEVASARSPTEYS